MGASASRSRRCCFGVEAEDNVQQPHCNDEPNPPAAGASAAPDVQSNAPPPVTLLHRHALESVFAFLRRGDLAAANSMRSLRLVVKQPAAPLFVVATSALGRHTIALGRSSAPMDLNADTMFMLTRVMPHLRGLTCKLSLSPSARPLLFPAALQQLHIDMCSPELELATDVTIKINTTLRAIGRLPSLLQLTMRVQELDPQVSFAPLAALPRLRILEIYSGGVADPVALSDTQAAELRALPWLRSLNIRFIATSSLRRLLRQPHDLQWQQISLPWPLDGEAAALLPQLPSLTKIDEVASCERFDWLRGLPNLTDLKMNFLGPGQDGRAESLVAGLQCCTNIEILKLHECPGLVAAHLADLLPRLPRLRQLVLIGFSIESLSFLEQPPLTSQLTTLDLSHCKQLPLADLRHVHALQGLKELWLNRSFSTPMDEYCQALLAPPSILLPQLHKFRYCAPPVYD